MKTLDPQAVLDQAIVKARNLFECPLCKAKAGQECRNVSLGDIHEERFPKTMSPQAFLSFDPKSATLEQLSGNLLSQLSPVIRVPDALNPEDIDWRLANSQIKCLRGRVVVEMFPLPLLSGELYLSDVAQVRMKPSVGVVLAVGEPWGPFQGHIDNLMPVPGDVVLVRPSDGTWISNADMGKYQPQGEVRVYGVYGEFSSSPQSYYWWDSILSAYTGWMEFRPYGSKIILRRDQATEKTSGGIYLLNQIRNAEADVVAVGPFEKDIKVGDRVCYDPYHVEKVGVAFGNQIDNDYVIGTQLMINYVKA